MTHSPADWWRARLERRRHRARLLVLGALVESPVACHFAIDLMRLTGLSSGRLYPALARIEREGWLTSHLEQPGAEPRWIRRVYVLSPTAGALTNRTATAPKKEGAE